MARLLLSLALALLVLPAAWAQSPFLWRSATGGAIRARPAVSADGAVYALSEDSALYAWVDGGSLRWRHRLGEMPLDCLALGEDGTAYAGLRNADLVAVNPRGGRIWTVRLDGLPVGDPAISRDGLVIVGTAAGTLSAFTHLGRVQWSVTLPGAVTRGPVIDGAGTIYAVASDRRLYALTPWGDFKWSLPLEAAPSAPVIGPLGVVLLGTEAGDVVAVDPRGDVAWKRPAGGAVVGVSVGAAEVVAATTGGVSAFGLDGTPAWRADTRRVPAAAPIIDGEGILLPCADGSILTVDPARGVTAAFGGAAAGAALLTADGTLLVGGRDWVVYAMKRESLGLGGPGPGAGPPAAAAWPQPGVDSRHTGRASAAPPRGNDDLLDQDAQWVYLQSLVGVADRDGMERALVEIAGMLAPGETPRGGWLAARILERIVGTGIIDRARVAQVPVNDFPDLRARAAGLLARLGSIGSRAALLSVIGAETDPFALAAEAAALGAIASDADGASARAIAMAWQRRSAGAPDPRLAATVVEALARIAVYEGTIVEPLALQCLVSIASTGSSASLRAAALSVLHAERKMDILFTEEHP